MGLLDLLLEPLSYGFLQRGLVAGILIGIICAVIGTFVVLKGFAFIGDALAHIAFTGIVVAFIGGFAFYLGALVAAVLAALGIGAVSRRAGISTDTSIGILFSGVFALGIVLASVGIQTYTVDLFSYLFGDILGVQAADLVAIALLGALVLLVVLALFKELLFVSFDPVVAEAAGLPGGLLQMLLLVLLAVTVVVSVQAVGVVLVVAMLVTPSATAYLLTNRFGRMMALGAGFGALSALIGFYLSYYLNVPSGGTIVLVASAFFLLALVFSPKRGGWRRLFATPAVR
ncbi:metal ABC transporter permease [Sphaerobacter thermophilus]|uniref:ABC-3 protein n=1 Tax=Sphaerobacter thermophilus (strain ATCC 49802 / DSM 20745 / KCCM 41009 / NCIMB 13125 / S 6022) TaxID=479434 RepID=D1C985_SPHTD|nr:metal ABC transporter permease [Sphaerobacter thermophilus]ACZ40378.1 ABC-3 protein [Sphaerobacter thermophilus DSM 20745]